METLIDSGAARSLISERAWNKIRPFTPQRPRPGVTLFSLSDNEIKNKGIVEIEILNKTIPVYIVPSLSHDLLLGSDGLRILEAEIYLYKNVIRLNGHSVQGWTVSESDLVTIGEVSDTLGNRSIIDRILTEYDDLFHPLDENGRLTTTTVGDSIELPWRILYQNIIQRAG